MEDRPGIYRRQVDAELEPKSEEVGRIRNGKLLVAADPGRQYFALFVRDRRMEGETRWAAPSKKPQWRQRPRECVDGVGKGHFVVPKRSGFG